MSLGENGAKGEGGTGGEGGPHVGSAREQGRGTRGDRGLVSDVDLGRERGRVLAIDVRLRIGRVRLRVRAGNGDRGDERVEVACRLVIGIVPVDHAAGPFDGTGR